MPAPPCSRHGERPAIPDKAQPNRRRTAREGQVGSVSVGFADSSPRGGAGQRGAAFGASKVLIFSPPRGGDVRGADREGRACLCARRLDVPARSAAQVGSTGLSRLPRTSPRARQHRSVQPASVGFGREVPSLSRNDSSPPEGERVRSQRLQQSEAGWAEPPAERAKKRPPCPQRKASGQGGRGRGNLAPPLVAPKETGRQDNDRAPVPGRSGPSPPCTRSRCSCLECVVETPSLRPPGLS